MNDVHEGPAFRRVRQKMQRRKMHDQLQRVERMIDRLLRREALGKSCHAHSLMFSGKRWRSCHAAPNLLLVYEWRGSRLYLHDLRTHDYLNRLNHR